MKKYFLITILFFLCIFCQSGSGVEFEEHYVDFQLVGYPNCSVPIGMVPVPSGPISKMSYVIGDNVTIKGRIVNRCPFLINNFTIALINESQNIEQDMVWHFSNLESGNYADFDKTVINEDTMSFIPFLLNIKIEGTNVYSEKPERNFSWKVKKSPYFENWDRRIDLMDYVPLIEDKIYFPSNLGIEKIFIYYQSSGENMNFIFPETCKLNKEPCIIKTSYGYYSNLSEMSISINNSYLKDQNELILRYTIEDFYDDYDPLSFPFDEIKTKRILFPKKISVEYYDSSRHNLEIIKRINFEIIEPNGFIYSESKSLNYSNPESCHNEYDLPSSSPNSNIDKYILIFYEQNMKSPGIESSGLKMMSSTGKIIYSTAFDICGNPNQIGLVFQRGTMFKVIFSVILFLSFYFLIQIVLFKDKFADLFEKYIAMLVFTTFGWFISFQRPYSITSVEIIYGIFLGLFIVIFLIRNLLGIKTINNFIKQITLFLFGIFLDFVTKSLIIIKKIRLKK